MGTRSGALLGIGSVVLAVVLGIAFEHATRMQHPETVVVPGVRNGNVPFAFDRLRESGLRVAIPSTIPFRETSWPRVTGQTPSAGTRVAWGSVVTLRVTGGFIGSPAGPRKLPVYRVPEFNGKPLADAVAWTKGKTVYWASDLPPLPSSNAKHLFDAYVITSQRPAAGSDLKLWTPARMRGFVGVRLTPLTLEVAVR
jgi:beta-lactam-binding protein with PASTA domain